MHHPASAFFTAEDKQRHPYLSSVLEPSTQKVIATAAVRVYYAPFINAHLNWTYSNLRGILVFGRDREGLSAGSVAGVPLGLDRAGLGTHGLRLKEKYWFRLVDIKTDRVVWMFSVPEVFEYNKDKPFFHYFSGATRMFGFCFDEDDEAAVFFKKVIDRTRRHSVFRPFSSNSIKKEKTRIPLLSLSSPSPLPPSSSPPPPPSSNPTPTPIPNANNNTSTKFSIKTGAKGKPVKPAIISSPAPHSFVHVSHVGVNTRGIIESSKNIEPAWGALIADLQGYAIRSPPTDVVDGGGGNMNVGFIKELEFAAGMPNAAESPSSASEASQPSPMLSHTPPAPSPTPVGPPPEKKRKIRRKVLIL